MPLCRCIAFELFARRSLLPVGQSLADYESRVHSLTLVDMSGEPEGGCLIGAIDLVKLLRWFLLASHMPLAAK